MFLTFPYIDQAITRFDRWSMSAMAMFQQLANACSDITANRVVLLAHATIRNCSYFSVVRLA
jgi:hypothetical protein